MARKTKNPTPTSPLDVVAGLIEERAKFEQWLEDLDAKKDSTPAKVYDRVHGDYLSRLQGVMEQLKSHTEALQTQAASLNKKLVELSSAEESRIEERSEAELRAKVGEMTPAEWDMVSKRADKELAKLKQDQEVIESDLDRIQGILEELAGGAPARVSSATPAPKVDEMAFLKSVVGTGPRASAAPEATPPAPAPPRASVPVQPPRPSVAAAAPAAAQTPTPVTSAPAVPASPPPPAAAAPAPAATPAAPAAPAAPSAPAAPPSPPAAKTTPTTGSIEVPKTLKCQECATMNYPSEWYCERCGAELTVV